jgi:Mor family transcriptional regulator
VSDIISRFCEELREALKCFEPGMEEELALQLERQMRLEFGGDHVRIKKCEMRGESLRDEIRRRWNGRNADDLAEEMGVHRSTIYRAIRYRRP